MNFEYLLHPYHLSKDIKSFILANHASELAIIETELDNYLNQEYWESKNARLAIIKAMDRQSVILDVLVQTVLIAQDYIPLISVCSAKQIKGMGKQDSATTVGEILSVIDKTDLILWDLENKSIIIKSNILLSDELNNRLKLQCTLPPLLYTPRVLRHNNSCAYLSIPKDSLILGDKENQHNDFICLDTLNTLNSQALCLDLDICYKFYKEFNANPSTEDYTTQKKTYDDCKEQFDFFVSKIQDRVIYFTHKFDKRGRVYSQGYQMNTQGTSFDKACINLKTKEYVTGEL